MRMTIAGRPLSVLACGVVLAASTAQVRADDVACQAVLAAVIKQAAVPVHQRITIESAAAPGKKLQSEMIHVGDTLYMQVQGRWMTRLYDGKKAADDARQAMQKAEHSCTRLPSETVEGQATDLYGVQGRTATGSSESQFWISTATGLPLRQHSVMLEQGAAKMKHEVRFDYTDVRVPAGVAR